MVTSNNKVLRIKDVVELCGVSRSTIYRWCNDPKNSFPKYIKLSATSTGWYAKDINNWLESLRNSEVA
ncbi:helix-turn-helix transcriptional regulator [Francisella sp. SYW-2]|uniref:helix-turn-helix transcriptional regulator n=1 Tax=Francisella sp. SYW-2 TaxID=2610886 RepID=UPI00123CC064|nr:AlpA family phage regulatory protein [Francisella sp. SYW-2]